MEKKEKQRQKINSVCFLRTTGTIPERVMAFCGLLTASQEASFQSGREVRETHADFPAAVRGGTLAGTNWASAGSWIQDSTFLRKLSWLFMGFILG